MKSSAAEGAARPRAVSLIAGAVAGAALVLAATAPALASTAAGNLRAGPAPAAASALPCASPASLTQVVVGGRWGWGMNPLGVALPTPPPPVLAGIPLFLGPGPETGASTSKTVTDPATVQAVAAALCASAGQPQDLSVCPPMPFSFPNTLWNYSFSFSAGDTAMPPVIVGPGGCEAVEGAGVVSRVSWPQLAPAVQPLSFPGAPVQEPSDWALPAVVSGCPPSGPPVDSIPPCVSPPPLFPAASS